MLRLVTSKHFFHLGDKFLEHLKHWMDAEKIMSTGIWSPGDELRVAASMMNLFHMLPRLPNSAADQDVGATGAPSRLLDFLQNFISTIIRLESVRHRYRQQPTSESPFTLPLARFLSRYPAEGLVYLFDVNNLAKHEVSLCILFLI